MSKRTTGIFIVLGGFISLLLVIYFVFFYSQRPEIAFPEVGEIEQDIAALPAREEDIEEEIERIEARAVPVRQARQNELEQLAAGFAERFGSFSNQSNYSNLSNLEIFMTPNMKKWVDKYILESRENQGEASIYYGISTKAATKTTQSFSEDAGKAIILVETVRVEAIGGPSNTQKKNQAIEIHLAKVGDIWKVDGAYWK